MPDPIYTSNSDYFREKTSIVLKKIIQVIILLLVFIFPLYFLPFTSDIFEFNKQFILISISLILLLIWSFKMVIDKRITIRRSPFDLPLLLILLVFILSTIFSQNRLISIIGLSGSLHWNLIEVICLYFFYYITTSNLESKNLTKVILFLTTSIFILSLINLLSYFSVLKPEFMNGLPFNPVAAPTTLSLLIVVALGLVTGLFINYLKRNKLQNTNKFSSLKEKSSPRNPENKVFLIALSYSLFVLTLVTTLFFTSPLSSNLASKITKVNYPYENFLELKASWNVAIDTFQNVPLFGSGPGTFLFYFNRYRPQNLNYTDLWNIRFNKANSEYLNILSELGLLGILAFGFLGLKVFHSLMKGLSVRNKNQGLDLSTITLGLTFTIFIFWGFTFSTTTTAFLLFLLLALSAISLTNKEMAEEITLSLSILKNSVLILGNSNTEKIALKKDGFFQKKKLLSDGNNITTEAFPWVFLFFSLLFSLFTSYHLTRFLIAEVYYHKAIDTLNNNEGNLTYEYLQKTINNNPYRDQYRNVFAQTSLLLANAISQQKELTDQDKNNIQQLLQQSIDEVKVSTETLTPQNAFNWELRGQIYRQLIGSTDGIENLAIEGYNNAILLDPSNPQLRLELGGIYYQLKSYDQALINFQNAIQLKNDYANAWYNLSHTYKEKQQNQEAYSAMQNVLQIISQDSSDYEQANQELEELKKLLPTETTETTPSAETDTTITEE